MFSVDGKLRTWRAHAQRDQCKMIDGVNAYLIFQNPASFTLLVLLLALPLGVGGESTSDASPYMHITWPPRGNVCV